MDPHRVLGIAPGASDKEIKDAYRKAALRWHPDRNAASGPEAAARAADQFKLASDAYEHLSGKGSGSGAHHDRRGGGGSGPRRPWSSHAGFQGGGGGGGGRASGYYNGSDDPFGFNFKESATTGDHRRRINRNIRNLYVSLAVLGVFVFLAPAPPSPEEYAKARKRRDDRRVRNGAQRLTYSEQVTPTLAPGSPLYTARQHADDQTWQGVHYGQTVGDGAGGGGLYKGDGGWSLGTRDGCGTCDYDGYEYMYAFDGGGDGGGDAGVGGGGGGGEGGGGGGGLGTPGAARYGQTVRQPEPRARATWRRDANPPRTVGEIEQRAALQAGWSRARFGAKVVANGGGEKNRAAAGGEAGGVARGGGGGGGGGGQRQGWGGGKENDAGQATDTPEWANGGYAGKGISRRVLPYHKRGGGGGGARAADELACARCGFSLSSVARFCSICGMRTTSPGSVVRRPYADPQDTGTNVGKGRERAKASAAAAAASAAERAAAAGAGAEAAASRGGVAASGDGAPLDAAPAGATSTAGVGVLLKDSPDAR